MTLDSSLPHSAPRRSRVLSPTCRVQRHGEYQRRFRAAGGAAGGGKTEALLWWLGEGIHVPSYSGVFFRRTYAQLSKSNDSPITKSFELYGPLGGTYKASEHRWRFPSGATIEFGHLQHEDSVHDYQGPAYHRVAFDELTQFSEQQYLYLFSRMRMRRDFPVRMGIRAASNPGGPGHAWVKERFVTREAQAAIQQLSARKPSPSGMILWPTENRAFVPARVADNPSLDVDDHIERMLTHLPAVLRERLLNGDWSVVEDALIRAEWLRYYKLRGDQLLVALDPQGAPLGEIDWRDCRRIATIDTAGTSQQKADERKGKPPSWSVCEIWDYWPDTRFLFLRHVWRARVNWNDLKAHVRSVLSDWRPRRVLVENAHHGPPLAAELRDGFSVELVSTAARHVRGEEGRPGKVERATPLLNKLERGEVFLPKYNNQWLSDLEGEWLSWTGLADETADQIDAAAYAVNDLLHGDGHEGPIVIEPYWREPLLWRLRPI